MSADEVEDPEVDDAGDAEEASEGTDPLKLYVIFMGVLAAVLGFFLIKTSNDRAAFERANAQAEAIFGGAVTAPGQEDRPTTIRSLAIGIQKYLQTTKEAKNKIGDSSSSIPVQQIRNQAQSLNLSIRNFDTERITPNPSKGYEEVSVTVQFEATDLANFSTFLYNLESSSTKIRVLEFKWDLLSEKDNPIQPGVQFGHRTGPPTAKFGFRRPIARR
jgi:uncharacterized protein YggE